MLPQSLSAFQRLQWVIRFYSLPVFLGVTTVVWLFGLACLGWACHDLAGCQTDRQTLLYVCSSVCLLEFLCHVKIKRKSLFAFPTNVYVSVYIYTYIYTDILQTKCIQTRAPHSISASVSVCKCVILDCICIPFIWDLLQHRFSLSSISEPASFRRLSVCLSVYSACRNIGFKGIRLCW